MTRIIAGDFGGRRIRTPARGTRPTADRAREALFSRLEHAGVLTGARVLDLYAGSGALGLEALSRGAQQVVLVESNRAAAGICRANVADLDVGDQAHVVTTRVEQYLARRPVTPGFDLVLADPPYELEDISGVLAALAGGWLAPGATVVLERSTRAADVVWPEPLAEGDRRTYGQSAFWFARRPPV